MSLVESGLKVFFSDAASKHRTSITFFSIIAFWVFGFWSVGAIDAFGNGFARASDMRLIRVALLDDIILETYMRYCDTPNGSKAKPYLLKITNANLEKHKDLSGSGFPLPKCDELVAAPN